MISIRESANAIDRLDDFRKETAAFYSRAIQSMVEYAVEIDPQEYAQFQAHLGSIGRQWGAITATDSIAASDMRSLEASLRGELRQYRDRSLDRVSNLRRQLQDTAQALAQFVTGIESNGSEHQDALKREMERLNAATVCEDLAQAQRLIRQAITGLNSSIERIRHENQALTLQFKDEIQALHREFQAERRLLYTDPQSGAWNRQKLDGRIDELIRQNQFFCLLFVAVGNLKGLEHGHPRNIVDDALKALVKRFHGSVGMETLIGRWSEESFVAVMDVQASAAIPLSRVVQKALAGRYAVQGNGESHPVGLQVTTAVIDRGETTNAAAFRKKLDQLAEALANG